MSINWFGALALLKKEVWRFLKVYHQTLFSPVVNIMLFLAVFCLSMGAHVPTVGAVEFPVFVSGGLIMMAAMQNAFANSSSSMVMGKVMGHFVDYLIPPLGAFELLFAFAFGAILRGLAVGLVAFVAISFFVEISFYNFGLTLFYAFFSCAFLAMLGILCGIISETFDHMSAVTSYIVTPLTFLSGTFYSTTALPPFWQNVAHFNPFFYMIDGFRYSLTGQNDGNIFVGVLYILAINFILMTVLFIMLKKSYKIRS
jgi:ABC-2 type transport system permease protein